MSSFLLYGGLHVSHGRFLWTSFHKIDRCFWKWLGDYRWNTTEGQSTCAFICPQLSTFIYEVRGTENVGWWHSSCWWIKHWKTLCTPVGVVRPLQCASRNESCPNKHIHTHSRKAYQYSPEIYCIFPFNHLKTKMGWSTLISVMPPSNVKDVHAHE